MRLARPDEDNVFECRVCRVIQIGQDKESKARPFRDRVDQE
jgi:hypothetical protein